MSNFKTSKPLSTASKAFSTKQQLMKYEELTRLMDNKEFHADMHEALDHHFEVLVMATMSAGKSTLLNAMLGIDLLPSCNEACTSIVYRLEDQVLIFGVHGIQSSDYFNIMRNFHSV